MLDRGSHLVWQDEVLARAWVMRKNDGWHICCCVLERWEKKTWRLSNGRIAAWLAGTHTWDRLWFRPHCFLFPVSSLASRKETFQDQGQQGSRTSIASLASCYKWHRGCADVWRSIEGASRWRRKRYKTSASLPNCGWEGGKERALVPTISPSWIPPIPQFFFW